MLVTNATSTNETMPGANDGTASASPSGGTPPYDILWSNGLTHWHLSNLVPGNYSMTITDANGCTSSSQVSVVASTCFIGLQLSATPTTCPDFADGSATVNIQSGGTGPFNYLWSNGQTTPTISNLVSSSYLVTVTDASGCSQTGQIMVTSGDTTPPSA
ncbi:MAG: SprB repeat-containing protein [Saprospiraceae bacterium]|nr:SprB repeat-containing protein [Saprospiraceae bacterium]